ncbi:hypothetical protein [Alistipes sp. ZOR0009]|uniref:hypothetical protein n=1 Tax=Alistipes sp. ZOR0009 TaxID=1339253 RepID=UPI000646C669|nr:hypothetical protein [Alistipes sp. ZOR0009]
MNIGDINIYVNDSGKKQAPSNASRPGAKQASSRQRIRNAIAPASITPPRPTSQRGTVTNRRAAIPQAARASITPLQVAPTPRKRVKNRRAPIPQAAASITPLQVAPPKRRAVKTRKISTRQPSVVSTTATTPKRKKRGFFSRAKSFVKRNARTALLPGVPRINRRKKRK